MPHSFSNFSELPKFPVESTSFTFVSACSTASLPSAIHFSASALHLKSCPFLSSSFNCCRISSLAVTTRLQTFSIFDRFTRTRMPSARILALASAMGPVASLFISALFFSMNSMVCVDRDVTASTCAAMLSARPAVVGSRPWFATKAFFPSLTRTHSTRSPSCTISTASPTSSDPDSLPSAALVGMASVQDRLHLERVLNAAAFKPSEPARRLKIADACSSVKQISSFSVSSGNFVAKVTKLSEVQTSVELMVEKRSWKVVPTFLA
mmetsp:Transcript_25746/g.67399  ORF Transcript_25746/g.67399 Transcript_25746/m.67399 type:complete len:266 (-) Transcript_25746:3389-4186(-)